MSETIETAIIEPPQEIKAIADKTAEFVRKNGDAFEQQILEKQGFVQNICRL